MFKKGILKTAGKAVGKQALSTGVSVAADLAQGCAFKESAEEHGRKAARRKRIG